MRSEEKVQAHFINDTDNKTVCKRILYHAPSVGDEMRIGGEGNEKFYSIIRRVWVYDEPDCPFSRVNIGVVEAI